MAEQLYKFRLGNIWSRWREVKAGEYALKMTRNPQAFISAMTHLANQNLADADHPPAWAYMGMISKSAP